MTTKRKFQLFCNQNAMEQYGRKPIIRSETGTRPSQWMFQKDLAWKGVALPTG